MKDAKLEDLEKLSKDPNVSSEELQKQLDELEGKSGKKAAEPKAEVKLADAEPQPVHK